MTTSYEALPCGYSRHFMLAVELELFRIRAEQVAKAVPHYFPDGFGENISIPSIVAAHSGLLVALDDCLKQEFWRSLPADHIGYSLYHSTISKQIVKATGVNLDISFPDREILLEQQLEAKQTIAVVQHLFDTCLFEMKWGEQIEAIGPTGKVKVEVEKAFNTLNQTLWDHNRMFTARIQVDGFAESIPALKKAVQSATLASLRRHGLPPLFYSDVIRYSRARREIVRLFTAIRENDKEAAGQGDL